METKSDNKISIKRKNQRLHINLDLGMAEKLKRIRTETGISISELIRESIRRLLQEFDESGSANIRVIKR